ncbi:MAG: homoserine dehydrogenase [Elusimicrobia bacterium]|nr:homoserine dehydrogenase [Elusimicrobiota bacterium]
MSPFRTIRVGIAGLGTVGAETVRILRDAEPDFRRRLGATLELAAVCDRSIEQKAAELGLARSVRRYRSAEKFAADPLLDVVVETIGGLDEARRLVLESLKRGRHVITANKRLLAHHWGELFDAARTAKRRLYFEASVAGGVPIVETLRRSLAGNRIRRVLGILNGTTNFILTRMARTGEPLKTVLAEAQRRGLAEKDPSLDLSGADAAHKVAVLASLVTGHWVRPQAVAYAGITGVAPEDMAYATSSLGRTVRLIGTVDLDWSAKPPAVCCHVYPTLVPLDHPLAGVQGEYNAVLVQASAAGDLMFYGKGAGAGPAASAVVGDLFLLATEMMAGPGQDAGVVWRREGEMRVTDVGESVSAYYLRLDVRDRPGALSKITGALARRRISISRIHQQTSDGKSSVPVLLTTHPARQRDFLSALSQIRRLPEVAPRHAWFRML